MERASRFRSVVSLMTAHKAMLEGLAGSKAPLWANNQLLNKIFGRLVNFIPFLAIKVELSTRHHL